jgi:hypothetical protein
MKNLIATAAVVGFLMTGTVYGAQTTLNDQQMDTVIAGTSLPFCTRADPDWPNCYGMDGDIAAWTG